MDEKRNGCVSVNENFMQPAAGDLGTIERTRKIRSGNDTMQIDEELTLKKLEIFLAFMRTGNLARAAADLQTSTVSVHRAIHSLESALRCRFSNTKDAI